MKLFLDLDNTLVSSEPLCTFDSKKYKNKAVKFDFHDMEDYYVVFERPGLQEFLDYAFANFDVSIWTAASREYGLFIIKNVILTKPNRRLEYYFFSYHCDWSEKNKRGHKGLTLIWDDINLPGFGPENTIIVDDLPEIKEEQPCNAIHIKPFEFTDDKSHQDDGLMRTQKKLEFIKNNPGTCPTGDTEYKAKEDTPRRKARTKKKKEPASQWLEIEAG